MKGYKMKSDLVQMAEKYYPVGAVGWLNDDTFRKLALLDYKQHNWWLRLRSWLAGVLRRMADRVGGVGYEATLWQDLQMDDVVLRIVRQDKE
jgi:hypothetical protein